MKRFITLEILTVLLLFICRENISSQLLVVDQKAGPDLTYEQQKYAPIRVSLQTNTPVQAFGSYNINAKIGFVQLCLGDLEPNNGLGATIYVNLRTNSYDGFIISSTAPMFFEDNFKGISTFYFPSNIPISVARWYYLEPVVQSGDRWGAAGAASIYDGGFSVLNGEISGFSLWFREGTVVWEPMVWGARIIAWGDNSRGQLNVPPYFTNAVAIAAGGYHSLALKADGTVVAWGDNRYGQTNIPRGLTNVVAIAGGDTHSLALKADGTVVVWGGYWDGQSTVPTNLTDVVAISAGHYHSLALKADGTVVGWGPAQLAIPLGLTNAVAIAAGYIHNVALNADGKVIAWGFGEALTNVPAGLSNVVAISVQENHSVALKADGTVASWGIDGLFTAPPGLDNAQAIASGRLHSLVLKTDQTVFGWGYAAYANVPPNLTNVVAIAAGGNHSLALVTEQPPYTRPLLGIGRLHDETELTIRGSPKWLFNVQYKDGLEPDVPWRFLVNLRLAGDVGQWPDLTAKDSPMRFYRSIARP